MRSSFFEFHVATTGMFTSRGALDTVSHNVANAAAVGYSRQVTLQRATTPIALFTGKGMVGTGSEIYGITQLRDVYLDKKYWNKQSTLGEYATKRAQLQFNEAILSEVDNRGLTSQFAEFFDTLQDLVTTAGDSTYRANSVQSANTLTKLFTDTYNAFVKQQKDINEEVKAVVNTINSLGTQIRTLNEKIRVFEVNGDRANDLRDQRALLVDELSTLVDVEAYETEVKPGDIRYVVKINGQSFVSNLDLRTLSCRERKATDENGNSINLFYNPEDAPGLYDIYWGDSDAKFNIYHSELSGVLKGLIDIRDGNNENYARTNIQRIYEITSDGTAGVQKNVYDPSTGTLLLPLDALATRVDLAESGGIIRIEDSRTGRTWEFSYTSYTHDTNSYTNDISATSNMSVGVFKLTEEGKKNMDLYIEEYDKYNNDNGIVPSLGDLYRAPFNLGDKVSIGATNDYKGVPYYLSRLNDLVRTFATAVNFGERLNGIPIDGVIGHASGNAYNKDGETGNPPTLFFTYKLKDGTEATLDPNNMYDIYKMTANNFYVNSALFENPDLINASSEAQGGLDNNEVLISFIKISTDERLFSEGKLQDYIIGMTGEIGIDIKQAINFEVSYDTTCRQIDNQRMSISGVDINEEISDMIKYNQQFAACSRLINIIDGIYDTLINRLGIT